MPHFGGDLIVPDKSLHELVWENLQHYGDDIAIIDESRNGASITYKELYDYSRKCAAYMQSLDIKKEDFVAICSSTSIEFTYLMIGIVGCGAIVSPSNTYYRKNETLRDFNISCPSLVFVDEEKVDMINSIRESVSYLKHVVVIGHSSEFTTVAQILKETDPETLINIDVDPANDIALAPRSSGTTGYPKCVLLPHKFHVTYLTRILGTVDVFKRDTSQAMYCDRAIYHISGFASILKNVVIGLRTITERSFQLDKMFRNVEKHKITTMLCVPPVLIEMANATHSDKFDLSSLKRISTAGAAMSPQVIQRVMEKYKVPVLAMYAMNETGLLSSGWICKGDLSNSSGRVQKGVTIKITNTVTQEECPTGTDGEIRVKSQQMMKGYFKNPEANAAAFDEDGWYKTGDIGHLDEDGNVYVVDRLKEIIQRGAIQISPAELESVIISHPKIADVGVVGIPDEVEGEIPKAFVVSGDAALTIEDVHVIVNENLAEYKHLKGGVEFVTSIPKSVTGKIQRNSLKKMAGF